MYISAIVLSKNEEKNIQKCLEGLKWCDERIVIDDYSEDKTAELAKSRGVKVYKRKLDNNFAGQRNFGLKKAKGDWVLFVDADEIVSSSLSSEVVRRIRENKFDGFLIPRKEYFFGKALNCADKAANDWSFGPIKILRLAKKDSGIWKGAVHEVWDVKGKVGVLINPLFHDSFPDITTALKKINFYSGIAAENVKKQKVKGFLVRQLADRDNITPLQIIIYPLAKFLKDFFWQKGFLDGTMGLVYCLLMSLQSFLTRSKKWEVGGRK